METQRKGLKNETKANVPTRIPQKLPTWHPNQAAQHVRPPSSWRLAHLALACTRPLKAYRSHGMGVEFNVQKGFHDQHLSLPCGSCASCRMSQARDWTIRLSHEAQMHEKSCYITLTYADDYLPYSGGLEKEDFQNFIRRFRKHLALRPDARDRNLRYYHCGEYGENATRRPHYHAIIYGQDFSEDRTRHRTNEKNPFWRSPTLERLWPWGNSDIGEVTPQSAAYVCGYVLKKGPIAESGDKYLRFPEDKRRKPYRVNPEYTSMSLKPGIGKSWLHKNWREVYPDDLVVLNGSTMKPPPYYDTLIKKWNPYLFQQVTDARTRYQSQIPEETREQRHARDTILRAKISQRKRDIA